MQEADIILAAIPQADGISKNRPAIVLRQMPAYGDFLICGVSTQLNQLVSGFDDVISPKNADFATSGLRAESLVRLGFLAVIPRRKIIGSIGTISPERHQRLLAVLSSYLINLK
jgi:mRNA interferase MazF